MYLLLIRHGESVDNVGGLYAGSRDSPLTNHGVLQARRLGAHLAKRRDFIGPIKKIFTSNLQRAYRTAEAVADAQPSTDTGVTEAQARLEVVQLPDLREKDFGSFEGKKFGARTATSQGDANSDSETPDSMRIRVNRFLDVHLAPIVEEYVIKDVAVVIVAHGIILSVLLRELLSQYSTNQLDSVQGEIIAAWTNTGVLQAKIEQTNGEATSSEQSRHRDALKFTVQLTNNVDHLQGLKKTRGGIGSAKFDSRQRTMDSFFIPASKKRKLDEDEN
ncbi:hypothetical protein DL766_000807 [Monosporascus sp. MC13-8B]|uniref:Phosphoglycerate mutase (2,3-diphosphoglycerate-dependent) n=1 Tax=Monosporascus cannonballus TaxID=155416 RepID=A0ABY0HHC6_9PEZI|nr:hypothetical protein DL762_001116 [Monosporascus cannonballus]RYO98393.1 hypothetical protein DL763_002232 [Monosporascus cannonballus]RYP38807.1 hypothetical protein DL766_000807 [Monosporascus sp. MC13-8B]